MVTIPNSTVSSASFVPRFETGQLYYTPGAQQALLRYQINPFDLVKRHVSGDWGDLCTEDIETNEEALSVGARLMSSYLLPSPSGDSNGDNSADDSNKSNAERLEPVKIWLITEADRSVTTLLLPDEY